MSIRPEVVGFSVLDHLGRLRCKVDTFAAAVAENAKLEVVPAEPTVVESVVSASEGRTCIRYPSEVSISQSRSSAAISSKKPWRSKSIGVNPAQAEAFTKEAREAGVRGVEYDSRTGELVANSTRAANAEVARRGFHHAELGHGRARPESVYE